MELAVSTMLQTDDSTGQEADVGFLFERTGGRRRRSSSSQRSAFLRRGRRATRMFGPTLTVVGVLMAVGMFLTGGFDLSSLDPEDDLHDPGKSSSSSASSTTSFGRNGQPDRSEPLGPQGPFEPPPNSPIGIDLVPAAASDTIRIATFNVKTFGPKKTADPVLMDQIAQIVSRFDVVAMQEIRGSDAEPIRALVKLLRDGGAPFAATVSQPIGVSDRYQESYAFLWNEATVSMIPQSDYVVADPGGRMDREPMACSFRCRVDPARHQREFSFTLINTHTSPSRVSSTDALNELDVLDDVYLSVAEYGFQTMAEDDCILLGDLNVDGQRLGQLGQISALQSVAGLAPTNTLGTETYDHILVHADWTSEFTGRAGVMDIAKDLGVSAEQAAAISDHQPVWAEFTTTEAGVAISSTTNIIR